MDKDLWRALSPLLDQVLDLPPADRPALVASVRANSPSLGDALAADRQILSVAPYLPPFLELSLAGIRG